MNDNLKLQPLKNFENIVAAEFPDLLSQDAGIHYRYEYKGIQLDPFRIAQIYGMNDFCMMTILKKTLCAGQRGHKDFEQDLKDIICAAQRKLEMLNEDKNGTN